jgi:hypothetical protein
MRPQLSGKKLDVMSHACHPADGEELKIEVLWSRLAWAKKPNSCGYLQNNQGKKEWRQDSAVEDLPSKDEVLISNHSTA